MMQNGELVIIDMGDFSTGSYLFDLGLIYMIYGVPELGLSMLATKIPTEQGLEFWKHFEQHYFTDMSAEERAFFDENKYFLASLRLIYSVTFLTHLRGVLENWLKDILLPKIMATRRELLQHGRGHTRFDAQAGGPMVVWCKKPRKVLAGKLRGLNSLLNTHVEVHPIQQKLQHPLVLLISPHAAIHHPGSPTPKDQ